MMKCDSKDFDLSFHKKICSLSLQRVVELETRNALLELRVRSLDRREEVVRIPFFPESIESVIIDHFVSRVLGSVLS